MNLGTAPSRVSDRQFPAGLRVLVVDDDPPCLRILEKMLRKCHYEVTKSNRAEIALSMLRENRNGFDIVISDVHMPDMDGFKLLEHVVVEMDLPVIMMSADDSKDVVMKGVTHGACDYLIKPVRIEALKNIWQHVIRKKKHEFPKDRDFDQSTSVEDNGDRQQKPPEDVDYSSSANEGNWKISKRRKEEEDENEERDDSSTLKKPRVVWSVELHQQFVQAVNQLGIDKAVPKKILELMNVAGLTRKSVASHLQKYRLYLRRLSGVSQHQSGLNNSFMGHPEATDGTMTYFNGLELQALAATGQLPAQSLATLHGIPTIMEPKQLADLHQSFVAVNMQGCPRMQQSNALLMHMPQQQPSNGQVSRPPLSMSQPLSSNGIRNSIVGNPASQAYSVVDVSLNQNAELQNNGFHLVSNNSGKRLLQEEVNSDIKGFPAGYDIFQELHQQKSQDWGLPNVGSTFSATVLIKFFILLNLFLLLIWNYAVY